MREEIFKENGEIGKNRTSNFELLRIILILFIITLHYLNAQMGGILGNTTNQQLNYYIAHFIESICICAVNCFILITGYHMINKETVKLNKIFTLIFIVLFYNILIYAIMLISGDEILGIESIKKFIKSIFSGSTWFVIIYIILYALIPYINKMVRNIGKSKYKNLLIILIIAFSIYPTFLTDVTVKDNGYGIINFITLYLIGGFIQKFEFNSKISKYPKIGFLSCVICTFIFSLFTNKAFAYNSIFNIISAIYLFLIFKQIKIQSKSINNLAKYTFGIYILHTNIFLRNFIWKDIAKCDLFYNSNYLIIHMIAVVLGIFISCLIIDFIRNIIFKLIKQNIEKRIKIKNYEITVS